MVAKVFHPNPPALPLLHQMYMSTCQSYQAMWGQHPRNFEPSAFSGKNTDVAESKNKNICSKMLQ
jgi:hypothetical protein